MSVTTYLEVPLITYSGQAQGVIHDPDLISHQELRLTIYLLFALFSSLFMTFLCCCFGRTARRRRRELNRHPERRDVSQDSEENSYHMEHQPLLPPLATAPSSCLEYNDLMANQRTFQPTPFQMAEIISNRDSMLLPHGPPRYEDIFGTRETPY